MRIDITVLIENKVDRLPYGAVGKHGLSILLETEDGFKILYDTGPQWEALVHNALLLGKSLKDIDAIVISHGHHDHGNDLIPILDYIGRDGIPIFIHPLAFNRKADIKMNSDKKDLLDMKVDLRLSYTPLLVYKGIWFSGSVPRRDGNPVHPVRNDKGEVIDEVLDDTSLYILGEKGIIILTGCGHSGVINIIEHAKEVLGVDRVYAIIGGFHGIGQPKGYLERTVSFLASEEAEILGPCHCSGPLVHSLSQFPGFIDVRVGTSISFEL